LRTESRMVKLIVKDDGKGFDTLDSKKGNGLGNIIRRAKELKGNAGIVSNPGQGTTVNFSIPV
jgi:signal transduction histidine kinase